MAINVTKPSVNLREKLNELETNKGLKGNEILQAETAQEVRSLIGAGRKNLLINGGFDVWQRGTSFTAAGYTADRWRINLSGGTATTSRQEFTPGTEVASSKYYAKFNVTTGNNYCDMRYAIEDVRTAAGKIVTLSFWARGINPNGGNIGVRAYQSFGGGGSGDTDLAQQDVTLTSSWAKYSLQFDIPSISGKTIGTNNHLTFYIGQPGLDTSTTAWHMDITGVQLEVGSVATDFEHRSYGEELALCQRYYYRINNTSNNPAVAVLTRWDNTTWYGAIDFPVTMRAKPTGSRSSATALNLFESSSIRASTSITLPTNESTETQAEITVMVSGYTGHAGWVRFSGSGAGWLAWSAEL